VNALKLVDLVSKEIKVGTLAWCYGFPLVGSGQRCMVGLIKKLPLFLTKLTLVC
jgi:hypothetical protein